MTADEIVRLMATEHEPYPMRGLRECVFCLQPENTHAADCLWLEIEKHANRCTETTNVHGLSFQCILTQGHIAMHQCEGNIAQVDRWMVTWNGDTTFYSNDPSVIGSE